MRRNTLTTISAPALLLAALVFIFGCGGDGGRSETAMRPLTINDKIYNARNEVLEDEGLVEHFEWELKKAKEKVWTPPPGIAAPQSLQDSIDRVEWLEKKVHGAKRRLQNDKKRLDDLIKEKEGNKGGEGGGC